MSSLGYYVPRRQDDQPKLLFWEMDEAAVFLLPLMAGLLMDSLPAGLVMGLVARHMFLKMKVGRGASYVTHAMYWYTPSSLFKLRRTPPSCYREFVG